MCLPIRTDIILKILPLTLILLAKTSADLYTSVDELSKWTEVKSKISIIIEGEIKREEERLKFLQEIRSSFSNIPTGSNELDGRNDPDITHPIVAFSFLNNLLQAIDKVDKYSNMYNDSTVMTDNLIGQINRLKEEHDFPTELDLLGCGEAIFRLQAFYNLSIDYFVEGQFVDGLSLSNRQMNSRKLDSNSCFELAKIAYYDEKYSDAMQLFVKSLNILEQELNIDLDISKLSQLDESYRLDKKIKSFIVEVLEYMAFTAYKNGQLKYSAQLTDIWLQSDPSNDRAKENLDYYIEELGYQPDSLDSLEPLMIEYIEQESRDRDHSNDESEKKYTPGSQFYPANYDPTHDRVVQSLCLESSSSLERSKDERRYRGRCIQSNFSPNYPFELLRIEFFNRNPDIIRIYDIVTEKEASYIRSLASNRLQRSTVQTLTGQATTEFRIAKTSWLSSKSDPIINRIEHRISEIVGLSVQGSEDLQVVNYGLGGYYGPHLDSSRPIRKDGATISKSQIFNDDRLLTTLLYLNDVDIGGSTVFPKLGVSVNPIRFSAVVWYNIKKDGLSDDLTLHTGCPVMLGSKWIATKWFREKPNLFTKPCGVDMADKYRSLSLERSR